MSTTAQPQFYGEPFTVEQFAAAGYLSQFRGLYINAGREIHFYPDGMVALLDQTAPRKPGGAQQAAGFRQGPLTGAELDALLREEGWPTIAPPPVEYTDEQLIAAAVDWWARLMENPIDGSQDTPNVFARQIKQTRDETPTPAQLATFRELLTASIRERLWKWPDGAYYQKMTRPCPETRIGAEYGAGAILAPACLGAGISTLRPPFHTDMVIRRRGVEVKRGRFPDFRPVEIPPAPQPATE